MAQKKRTKSTNSANFSGLQEPNYFTNIQENVLHRKMANVIPWNGLSSNCSLLPPVPRTPLPSSAPPQLISQKRILKTYLGALTSDKLFITYHLILCIPLPHQSTEV